MFAIHVTEIKRDRPFWFCLETASDQAKAIHRARNYALDHACYVCVTDGAGKVIYGTDPAELDRAIIKGLNKHFSEISKKPA